MVIWSRRVGFVASFVLVLGAFSLIAPICARADVFTLDFDDGTGDMASSVVLDAGPVTATITTGVYYLDTNEVIDAGYAVYKADGTDPDRPTGYGVCTTPMGSFCGDTVSIDGIFGNDILLVTFDSPYAVDVLSVTFTDGDHDSNFVDGINDDRDQVDILVDGSFILLKQEIDDGGLFVLNQNGVTTIGFGAKRGLPGEKDSFFLSSITIDVNIDFVDPILTEQTDPLSNPGPLAALGPDVPEPAALGLLGFSLLGIFALFRQRRVGYLRQA